MSAWHGIYADVLRQRFSGLVAYGVVLTGNRDRARQLAQLAMESVFARARAPRGVSQAERTVRREMLRFSLSPDAVAGSGDDTGPNAAPVEDAESHREIRSWLASLHPYERAAAVLQSLDGLDEEGVRRALGKKAPLQDHALPEAHANEVRALYRDEAARYASPSGGANGSIDASRGPRRKALARSGLVAGTVALVAGGLGFGAAQALDLATVAAPVPSASATPSPSVPTVEWDPGADLVSAMGGLRLPACGDEWAPAPQSVNGISPAVVVVQEEFVDQRWAFGLSHLFEYGENGPTDLLYIPGIFVITKDGVVVHTQDLTRYPPHPQMLEYMDPSQGMTSSGMMFDGTSLCAAREAWDEQFEDVDWDALNEEQTAELEKEMYEFEDTWKSMPTGEYQVYFATPIILGEQAALAGLIMDEGVQSLGQLYWGLADTDLANDPRIAAYCHTVDDGSGYVYQECTPPEEVLKELLAREIDPDTVVDAPPGIGISSPQTMVVSESA